MAANDQHGELLPLSHLPSAVEAREGAEMADQQLEKDDSPRLYFSTGSHLYELVYQRRRVGGLENAFVEVPVYSLDFGPALRELPFTGDTWLGVMEALEEEDEQAALLHLSPTYHRRLGHFTRKTHAAAPLDVACVVVIRPSHATAEIARLLEQDGESWYEAARYKHEKEQGPPPPEASTAVQLDQEDTMLYDVFARGRLLGALASHVRLPLHQALQVGQAIIEQGGGMLLLYNELGDTLEWVHPQEAIIEQKMTGSDAS